MKKLKKSGIIAEFKAFISKGSVVDLAVGVIIGGAFTAIVTALTTNIFQPIINALIALLGGGQALASARTILGQPHYLEGTTTIDWDTTIFIDWGAFISAVINFFLVAIILFVIVKSFNKAKEAKDKLAQIELEKYYEKHPEEKPAPVEEKAPAPTQEELLTQIRDILKDKKTK